MRCLSFSTFIHFKFRRCSCWLKVFFFLCISHFRIRAQFPENVRIIISSSTNLRIVEINKCFFRFPEADFVGFKLDSHSVTLLAIFSSLQEWWGQSMQRMSFLSCIRFPSPFTVRQDGLRSSAITTTENPSNWFQLISNPTQCDNLIRLQVAFLPAERCPILVESAVCRDQEENVRNDRVE